MGWDQDFLQKAVDTCTNPSGSIYDCPIFNIQDRDTQSRCNMKIPSALANEKVTGIVGNVLPGNVAIQYGPQPATLTHPPPKTTTVAVPSVGYSPGSNHASKASYLPGQVFITQASSTQAAAPTAALSAPEFSAEPAIQQVAPEPTEQVAPATTEAPQPSTTDDGLPVVSTQYITVGDVVSEIIWKEAIVYVTEQEDVTTTVTVTPSAVVRKVRHVENHVHRHANRHARRARR